MNLRIKQIYFNFWIYLPIILLIGLVAFIYATYMMTLVIPLINHNYNYSQSITQLDDSSAPKLLLTLKQVALTSHNMLNTLTSNEIMSETQKGWIYFGSTNTLFLVFLIGFMNTLFTDPGRVPKDWNKVQENKVQRLRIQATFQAELKARVAIENERRLYRNLKNNRSHTNEDSEHLQNNSSSNGSSPLTHNKKKSQWSSRNNSEHNFIHHQIPFDIGPIDGYISFTKEFYKISSLDSQSLIPRITLYDGSSMTDKADTPDQASKTSSERYFNQKLSEEIKNWEEEIFDELLTEGRYRRCSHCSHYKPERAHHCRQCNACTLKMDHHCPWVNNCIGYYNYKYFMIMLIYSVLSLWFVWITYTEVVGDTILNNEVETYMLFTIVLMYILTLTLAIIFTIFAVFHFYLIYNGKTTLEYCEKNSKFMANALVKYGGSPWDNFIDVFGTNPLLWILPIAPNYEKKGIDYTRTPNSTKNQRKS